MKKTILEMVAFTAVLLASSLSFSSCKDSDDYGTIDLRNKPASSSRSVEERNAHTSARAIEKTDEPFYYAKNNFVSGGNVEFSKSPFVLETDPNGIKITYTEPEEIKALGDEKPQISNLFYCYQDDNNVNSTREYPRWVSFDQDEFGGITNIKYYDNLSFIFPATIANKTMKGYICIQWADGSEYNATYRVTSGGGIGIIDTQSKNFDSITRDHITISEGKLEILDVIPPDEQDKYIRINVLTKNTGAGSSNYSWNTGDDQPEWVGAFSIKIREDTSEDAIFSIDLANCDGFNSMHQGSFTEVMAKAKSCYFIEFTYCYTIDGYDAEFQTPTLRSSIYKNTFKTN